MSVENAITELKKINEAKGYILFKEFDEIINKNNIGIEYIDSLSQNFIIKFDEEEKKEEAETEENIVDKAHTNYDQLFEEIISKYNNLEPLINYIKQIKPSGAWEVSRLIRSAQNGDEYSYNRLIDIHLRSLIRIAYSYSSKYNIDFEEAIENGFFGLIDGIKKYPLDSKSQLGSYISRAIYTHIHRYGTLNGEYLSKQRLKPNLLYIYYLINKLELNLSPEDDEYNISIIKSSYKIDESEIRLVLEILRAIWTVEPNDYDQFFLNYLENKDNFKVLTELENLENKEFINNLLESLNDREKKIILKRFGFEDKEYTLEELGKEMEVTRERVRQIQKKGLEKLKRKYLKIIKV